MGRNLMKLSLFVGIGECHFEAPESLIVPDLLQLYPHTLGGYTVLGLPTALAHFSPHQPANSASGAVCPVN